MPLERKVSNAETRTAMEESGTLISAHRARYVSAQVLFDALDKP